MRAARTIIRETSLTALKALSGLRSDLFDHGYLICQLTLLFVQKRYKGSALGLAWAMITPLALLLVYTLAFSFILGIKWSQGGQADHAGFALVLFCGLTAFDFFSNTAVESCGLMADHPSFVKKVIFPTQALPVALVLAGLVDSLIRLAILCLMAALFGGGLPKSAPMVLAAYIPLIFLTLGCSFFLSSLGAFFKDTRHAAAILTQMLFFMTPVFYPPRIVPAWLSPLVTLNPLARIVEFFRQTLLWGEGFSPGAWIAVTAASFGICLAGYAFFMRNRMKLADVV